MKITDIRLSIFELPTQTPFFNLELEPLGSREVWRSRPTRPSPTEYHVLHVLTDEGIEGVCTVGDARYTTMRQIDLEHLRHLAIGEDPLERERMDSKLRHATRHVFTMPGWFGAFDNCLWDIAGKAANKPVHQLIGAVRDSVPAYYNYRGGGTLEAAIEDCQHALSSLGFKAVKDHLSWPVVKNASRGSARSDAPSAMRSTSCTMPQALDTTSKMRSKPDALSKTTATDGSKKRFPTAILTDSGPSATNSQVPVMALETLMHEPEISKIWLEQGACDLVRAHARHGTTAVLDLAQHAAKRGDQHRTQRTWRVCLGLFIHTWSAPYPTPRTTNTSLVARVTSWDERLAC